MEDLRGGVLKLEHRYEVLERGVSESDSLTSRYAGVLHPSGVSIDISVIELTTRFGFPERVARAVAARIGEISRKACGLRSPYVLRVIDYGELDACTPFTVADAVSGPLLSDIIRHQGRLPLEGTVKVVSEIAEVLSEAHAQGFGHFAVRPELVAIEESASGAHARLGGFGQSLLRHELMLIDGDRLTPALVRWCDHIAPETFNEEVAHRWLRNLNPPSAGFDGEWGEGLVSTEAIPSSPNPLDPVAFDVFGLAILTYRCLTGEHPFIRDPEMSLAEQLRALEAGGTTDPHELGVKLPASVWTTLRSGLARDPGARPSSAMDFARKLERAANGTEGIVAPRGTDNLFSGSFTAMDRQGTASPPEPAEPPVKEEAQAPREVIRAEPQEPTVPTAPERDATPAPTTAAAVRVLIGVVLLLVVTNLATLTMIGFGVGAGGVAITPVPGDATWTRIDAEAGVDARIERIGAGAVDLDTLEPGRYMVESKGNHPVEIKVERTGAGGTRLNLQLPRVVE